MDLQDPLLKHLFYNMRGRCPMCEADKNRMEHVKELDTEKLFTGSCAECGFVFQIRKDVVKTNNVGW